MAADQAPEGENGRAAALAGGQAPGATGTARAAILIVERDPGERETLYREMDKRYGADYQIVVCGEPAEAEAQVADLLTAGTPVALVIGGVGAADPAGLDVFAAIRGIDPTVSRVATVRWGEWETARPIFDAITTGTVGHWVTRPVQSPDEDFHQSITQFFSEWTSERGGSFEAVQVIGQQWSGRSQELRDTFSRNGIPVGFHDADTEDGLAPVAGRRQPKPRSHDHGRAVHPFIALPRTAWPRSSSARSRPAT